MSYFVAAGDAGLPAEYPSSSPNVISVGGTTLHFNSSGAFSGETGWASGGGGCSAYESATAAQSAFSQYGQVNCAGKRATPDVAFDADPNSGVSVYDSTPYSGQSGWFTVGGTSAATPMWAAAAADAGVVVNSTFVYGSNISYRDITSGNNGAPCLVGYDLCSGRGSWLFSSSAGTTTTSTSTSTTTSTSTSTSTTTTSTSTTTTAPASGVMSVALSNGSITKKGPNYKVPLTASVSDATGAGISGATVSLSVYVSSCGGSPVATGSGTTSSSGSVTLTFSTKSGGNWCAVAGASAPGYAGGSSNDVYFTTP